LAHELPRVARQRLDVTPLPFGVEGVEGEAALARPRDAGEDDQLVAGQVEVDVAEIVFAGAADDDGRIIHDRWCCSCMSWDNTSTIQTSGVRTQGRATSAARGYRARLFTPAPSGRKHLLSLALKGRS